MSNKKGRSKMRLKGKRIDDKRIEVGGVIFYESSKSIAVAKYGRTYKKKEMKCSK